MLELYHWEPNANSGELLICLHEKGVQFRSHYVDLLQFEQLSPEFLALNPRGQVPVLVHEGRVLAETTLILEYLDAAFPQPPLVPESPAGRYCMRVWTKLADDSLAPALMLLGWHTCMAPKMKGQVPGRVMDLLPKLPRDRQAVLSAALTDACTEDQLQRASQSLTVVVARLEEALGTSAWLAGDSYSLADIAIYPMARSLQWLRPEAVSFTSTPRLAQWLRVMRDRPAVQAALGFARSACPEGLFAPGPELGRWG